LLIGFRLIPGALELADLNFVGGGGFFLSERCGREKEYERQEDETFHFVERLFVEFWRMLARSEAMAASEAGDVH
jgi:hypothetical protein